MLYSKLFGKTTKNYPKDEVSTNAKLLLKAGFIDKLMTGSYTLLYLGLRVKSKIENIIRCEMNAIGSQETLMPLLHPKSIWNETGRWEKAKEVMYQFAKDEKEYALSFTHEEIVLDLVRKHAGSYKDFPIKIYHFSTKFRNEPRAKSGLLRAREFIMKDLYSLHISQKDLDKFYWQVAQAYQNFFKTIGLETKIVEAAGGVFTSNITHEFQVFSPTGEDIVYYCENCDLAQNKEIAKFSEKDNCPKCQKPIVKKNAIEVGNIFRFGTSYSEKMGVYFISENGEKKLAYLGSYGIGVSRLIGTLAEIFHDEKGIIWPKSVAPYQVHLVGLDLKDENIYKQANNVYGVLLKKGIEVLFDDRVDISAGEKFADADLIGIPVRLVISKRTGEKVEFKKRNEQATKLINIQDLQI